MLAALSAGGAPAAGGRGALSGGAAGRATCRSRKAQASPRAGWMSLGPGAGRRRSGRCGTPPQSAARLSSWRAGAWPLHTGFRLRCGRGRPPLPLRPPPLSCASGVHLRVGCGGMPDSSGPAGMRSSSMHSCRWLQCCPLCLWSAPPPGRPPPGRMRPRSRLRAPSTRAPHLPPIALRARPRSRPRAPSTRARRTPAIDRPARAARPRDSL